MKTKLKAIWQIINAHYWILYTSENPSGITNIQHDCFKVTTSEGIP